ncbi:trehalose-phosphatase [Salipiger sp. IMCC34102]|uniref:trehalose-phosphatase n=1 Tax=Salipiger sp. IMCC34102 TaxID=2510647 RepID=UPI0013EE18A3|nr:trehalose-phosphatase [Salipiger sp. IMCC34102]
MTDLNVLDLDRLFMCLDFDGTLVELADTPLGIDVPEDLPRLLANLHERLGGRLAIVTGREIATLEGFLPDFPGDIYGAHGAEARIAGVRHPHPAVGSPQVEAVQSEAEALVSAEPGLIVEPKQTGVVVHYRNAPVLKSKVERKLADAVRGIDNLELHASKMAVEVRPIDASKARAVERAMAEQPEGIRPLVAGDDVTDEEAMEVAQTMDGICIKVGPGDTIAAHRLDGPSQMISLIRTWLGEAA